MYEKKYQVKFYEVDYQKRLKESVVLNFLQDIAAEHAEELGFGCSFIKEYNLAWFLLKYHIKFCNRLTDLDTIKIETYTTGIKRIYCNRDFEIYSSDGILIAMATSSWAIIDLTSKKIVNPNNLIKNYPESENKALEMFQNKHLIIDSPVITKNFDVRYDDIDINGHVNNCNYLIWSLETVPFEYRSVHSADEIEILYKSEIKPNTAICSKLYSDDNFKTTYHNIVNVETNEVCCTIKICWI